MCGREAKTDWRIKVQHYFKKLNVFKSAGPNDMHRRALKDLADIIAEALANYHAQDVKRTE